ncbi:MAG: polyribonucleotide nucleotidyltransferase [candidate division KSB1 bacterium]|nr:polyribonucleotide nucleotidyltransferase [candidate division KSB1 bacterium]
MIVRKSLELGHSKLIIESGKLAKQADGAVWVQFGDSVILATAVAGDQPMAPQGFFPLSVDYREKAYAAGKIPGGFFKREGRPSETEVLNARLIDRPIRPLFPEDFPYEVQVIVWVLSADRENDADVLGVIGASAALTISDIPFGGPVGAVRVGRLNGAFVVNPTFAQLEESDLDLVVAGTEESVIMMEGEAREIAEDDLLAALDFGHRHIKEIVALQRELAVECGKPKREYQRSVPDPTLVERVNAMLGDRLEQALRETERARRSESVDAIKKEIVDALAAEFPESEPHITGIIEERVKKIVREMILKEDRRLDGRGPEAIREVTCEVGVLPRAHGSALFTRGQTQALAATTLGTKMDEQKIDDLEGEFWKSYMLHYNFPPFSVGEVRPVRGPSRREIGHGNLAERALKPMIPSDEVFPYTVRIVSDILESNGSSSMATVCAGSLSLMDAGVPVKAAVAGIAMGLVKGPDRTVILTDILGEEDHLGDMDFKVAGSRVGVTAFQLDIKTTGLERAVLQEALHRAKEARHRILDIMDSVLDRPRPELSRYAPRIVSFKIPVDSIGTVIGPGGKTIREIIQTTGATIDIEDDGTVLIASVDPEACNQARRMVEELTAEPEVGKTYVGVVKTITNFGAFVEILPGKEGLLHISQISNRRVERVEDVLKVGQKVEVKLLRIGSDGKLDLSRKALLKD